MPRFPDLSHARRDTAEQLAAVVESLRALRNDAVQRPRADESQSLLRQILRVLTLIQSAQTARGISTETAGGIFGKILGGISRGLGIASAAAGLIGLFRGRRAPESPLAPTPLPQPLSLEVANTDQILRGFPRFDHSAGGDRRLVPAPVPDSSALPAAAPMQVVVNVSAMDSRSFSDHAPALAQAVRDAMLHMHPLNHVIRESL